MCTDEFLSLTLFWVIGMLSVTLFAIYSESTVTVCSSTTIQQCG